MNFQDGKNAPTNNTDPSGLFPTCVFPWSKDARWTNGTPIAKEIAIPEVVVAAMQEAWKQSFKNAGKDGWEHAASIFEKGGKITVSNIVVGKEAGAVYNGQFPLPTNGETMIGRFHTHPYGTNEGGHEGVSFSGFDVYNAAAQSEKLGPNYYVMAGTYIFVLVPYDKAKALKVNVEDVVANWEKGMKGAKGTFQEQVESAVIASIQGTGLAYYKAKTPAKAESVMAQLVNGGQ